MPTQRCECGAKYRFPESAVGKRAKCKKCGTIIVLEGEDEGAIPIADDGFMDEMAAAAERSKTPSATPGEPGTPTHVGPPVSEADLPSSEATGRIGKVLIERDVAPPSYWKSLFTTLMFPSTAGNLVTFAFVWGMLFVSAALLSAVPMYGRIGQVIILGWFCAYRFSVITEAAAGERDLPALALGTSAEIIGAILQWLGSWAVVLLPACVCMVVMVYLGFSGGVNPMAFLSGGIAAAAQSADVIAVIALVFAGILAWPMIVLCVALGGFATLSRLDLIFVTLAKTFPAYLLTAVIVFGADLLGTFVTDRIPRGGGGAASFYFMGHLIATGVRAYLEIVAMLVIGLYYHHFKDRFAWSWG
jgi:hypothetical protein